MEVEEIFKVTGGGEIFDTNGHSMGYSQTSEVTYDEYIENINKVCASNSLASDVKETILSDRGIIALEDLENFSNKYKIPMHFTGELPGAFSIVIFQRDEQFTRSILDMQIGVGILVHYKVLPNDYGDDKVQLVKRMRELNG